MFRGFLLQETMSGLELFSGKEIFKVVSILNLRDLCRGIIRL